MDSSGFVFLTVVANFNRVRHMTAMGPELGANQPHLDLVYEAVRSSAFLEFKMPSSSSLQQAKVGACRAVGQFSSFFWRGGGGTLWHLRASCCAMVCPCRFACATGGRTGYSQLPTSVACPAQTETRTA